MSLFASKVAHRLSWLDAQWTGIFDKTFPASQPLLHCEVIMHRVPSVDSYFGHSRLIYYLTVNDISHKAAVRVLRSTHM